MRHDPTFWLLARASGLTAYVMLTLSVLAGLSACADLSGLSPQAKALDANALGLSATATAPANVPAIDPQSPRSASGLHSPPATPHESTHRFRPPPAPHAGAPRPR